MKRLLLGLLKKLKFLPPPFYVKVYYEYYTGKKLDLDAPREFNEKIQWLKVYYRNPILTQLVDKYAVRDYVKEKVGDKYLNELLGVYNRAKDVDFDALPDRFVIKGVHGYHFNLIVPDKSALNPWKARWLMRKWMSKNQYYRGGLEWAYKNVPPRLVAEAFLEEPGQESINDYKFFCFGGIPNFVQIDHDRTATHSRCFYDMDWNRMPFLTKGHRLYEKELKKPRNFDEMIGVVTKLAEGFPFVRVDLYNIDGRILFGEMTFYPADGRREFVPEEYNTIIGDYLKLPAPVG
ncbi:ATP-grasp fold amidoligase family protein [Robiginitalea marina]|uniref:Glycosyltransferase n=1 Tax=Robiginitalea marina TaxID=2954105 RepID=A0ABT1AVD6_9FLAO|nr:ATP-grasp fold amidoligase family protein [Robiginitalea marina]MCO5724023.1 glycosyltransferase [Robiginitalea marina]